MKKSYYNNSANRLRQEYDIDVVNDVLLIRENRVILYAETSNYDNIKMFVISGNLSSFGLPDKESIQLTEILDCFDLNNKYGEVSGKEEYRKDIVGQISDFSKESNVTFPIISGEKRTWIRLNTLPLKNNKNLNAFFITDVTQYLIHEEKIFEKTHKDSLTKLFNRYTLDYHYGERYHNENFHVMYLDLDDFKVINDTEGHNLGNDYLKEFANLLLRYSNGKSLFYRIGGDEFVGLIFDSTDNVIEIAKNILSETTKIEVKGSTKILSTSIGVVKATKAENLIKKADELLYEAKQKGKNMYIFSVEE